MEEILASIRRIISEDEPAADTAAPEAEPEPLPPLAAAPAREPEAEDVLELTERLPEPASPALQSVGDLDIYAAERAAPEPASRYAASPIFDDEPLVSEPIAASSASAFGHLAQRVAMPREGRTLEDVVREMLNPLLKAWLDQHLEAIVQAKVEEEVERIARRGVG